jgi:predicted transcriptional regulator
MVRIIDTDSLDDSILNVVVQAGESGVRAVTIARTVNRLPSTVNYRLKSLEHAGLVRLAYGRKLLMVYPGKATTAATV